jgi:D-alanyl-D-alanine carboxypeptidase (penicillin-binding protein 5/6)
MQVKAVLLTEDYDDSQTVSTSAVSLDSYTQNTSYYQYLKLEDINAKHALVINKTTNEIIFEKDADSLCYPASTTKILTAVVALEYIEPSTVFKVGSELQLVPADSSLAYISEGEEIPLKDLLYGLMLPSGNDVGYTIAVNVARRVSGNSSMSDSDAVDYFANLMNETAQKIGMENSHFVVPDGFHDADHYVTTRDMMKLLIYAENFELLKQVVSTYEYQYKSNLKEFDWINSNRLLDKSSEFYYEGVTGFKTGYHDDAGHCVAITCNKDGIELYIILMDADTMVYRNRDTLNLLNMVYNPSAIKLGLQWDLQDGETLPEGVDIYGNPIVTTVQTNSDGSVYIETDSNGNIVTTSSITPVIGF